MADKTSKIKEINHKHKLFSKIFKRALALFIIVIINFNSFSAVVSSNDGSAFIINILCVKKIRTPIDTDYIN